MKPPPPREMIKMSKIHVQRDKQLSPLIPLCKKVKVKR